MMLCNLRYKCTLLISRNYRLFYSRALNTYQNLTLYDIIQDKPFRLIFDNNDDDNNNNNKNLCIQKRKGNLQHTKNFCTFIIKIIYLVFSFSVISRRKYVRCECLVHLI